MKALLEAKFWPGLGLRVFAAEAEAREEGRLVPVEGQRILQLQAADG
jgi:hypothetical protein